MNGTWILLKPEGLTPSRKRSKSYKVGDYVEIPAEHRYGVVLKVNKEPWKDRNDKVWKHHWYFVPSDRPGSPREQYLARELELIERGTLWDHFNKLTMPIVTRLFLNGFLKVSE